MSKVSIVVPIYNASCWLPECFASLRQQGDCELVLVDDGSTDSSAEMCRQFLATDGVRGKLVQQSNGGLSSARNAGIAAASGQYIAFCDADDAYLPGGVPLLLKILEEQAECDIAVGQFTRKKGETAKDGRYFCLDALSSVISTLYQEKLFHQSAWGKLYRRRLFDHGPNFAEGRWYEDFEFLPRIYHRTRNIAFTTSLVYYYRPNRQSFLNRWSPARADALYAADSVRAYVAMHMPLAVPAATSRRFSAYFNIFLLALRHSQGQLAGRCLAELHTMRRAILADRRCRPKNRLGAALCTFLPNFHQSPKQTAAPRE